MRTELTMTEAAKELGVARQAIHAAIKAGRLPALYRTVPPFGRVLFIQRSDFEAWAAQSHDRRKARKPKDWKPGWKPKKVKTAA